MKLSLAWFDRGAVGACVLAALAVASPAWSAPYHLIDLGKAEAVGIAGTGVVAGNKLGDKRPMRWNAGRWHALQEPGNSPGSVAYGINHGGDISGYVATMDGHRLPAVWLRGTATYATLPLPEGETDGVASAIANDGRAAGSASGGDCLVWDASGAVTDIGKPSHTTACHATAINIDGDVTVNASSRAFVWRHGAFHDIGNLGGGSALAFAINRHGQVAGSATDALRIGHAVIHENGHLVDLGAPDPSWVGLAATALNDKGVAVGNGWSTNDGVLRAVLFKEGQAFVLNSLADDLSDWNFEVASGIANDGTIVGWGTRGLNHKHAFMLVPTGTD